MARTKTKGRGTATKWRDEYYVEIYDLVRQGMSKRDVAEVIGISTYTLNKWIEKLPALKAAVRKARGEHKDGKEKAETFIEYIYRHLSPRVQEVWDELEEINRDGNSLRKMELLSQQPDKVRQHLFIHALVCGNFNMSDACKRVGVPKSTYETWTLTDPNFALLIEEVMWHKKNFFESALIDLVAIGNPTATVFANKTMNRDRGYALKVDHQHSGGMLHGVVDLDAMDNVPIDMKRQLLAAMRAKLGDQREAPKIIEALPQPAEAYIEEDD